MNPKRPIGEYSSPACFLHELEEQSQSRSALNLQIKRIYDEPVSKDGYRVLVDRIWPRGVTRERAKLNEWLKTIAPSTELRKWFGHDPKRWQEFRKRYRAELLEHRNELAQLAQRAAHQRVTLLYAAREPQINHAVVIEEAITKGLEPKV
jgi:uncharacterized protein YeaO (DUF488 family)